VRDGFQVRGIAASAITADMIKVQSIRNRAISLFPKPDVAKVQASVAPKSPVAVFFSSGQFPAACLWVYCVGVSPAVPWVIHLRGACDVPKPRVLGNRRVFSTTAEAFTRPTDALVNYLVVAFQKADITARYRLFSRVGTICNAHGRTTTTSAFSRRVRASRVVWLDRVSAGIPLWPMTDPVTKKFARNLKTAPRFLGAFNGILAPAQAKPARVGRRLGWTLRQIGGAQPHLVALNKPPSSGESAVSTYYRRATAAMAQSFAKLNVGHPISSIDIPTRSS
jgi:hypothetical protein